MRTSTPLEKGEKTNKKKLIEEGIAGIILVFTLFVLEKDSRSDTETIVCTSSLQLLGPGSSRDVDNDVEGNKRDERIQVPGSTAVECEPCAASHSECCAVVLITRTVGPHSKRVDFPNLPGVCWV